MSPEPARAPSPAPQQRPRPVPPPPASAAPEPGHLGVLQTGAGNAAVARAATAGPQPTRVLGTESRQGLYGNAAVVAAERAATPAGTAVAETAAPASSEAAETTAETAAPARAEAAETKAEAKPSARSEAAKGRGKGGAAGAVPTAAREEGKRPTPAEEQPPMTARDPEAILSTLSQTPPSALGPAMSSARTASNETFGRLHQDLAANPPSLERPSGLPRKEAAAKREETGAESKAKPEELKPKAGEQPEMETEHVASEASLPLAGTPEVAIDRTADEPEEVAQAAQELLTKFTTRDESVNTSAGRPRPTVEFSGEADPGQMNEQLAENRQTADQEWSEARHEAAQDQGENNIYPVVEKELLVAQFSTAEAPSKTSKVQPAMAPPEVAAGFDRAAAGTWTEEIARAQAEHAAARDQKEADEQRERDATTAEIARLEGDTAGEQTAAQLRAKAQVNGARENWMTELGDADKAYMDKSESLRTEYKGKIDDEKGRADEQARLKLEDAEQRAEKKKRETERQAEAKKREAERKSDGFFGWLKSKVKAFFKALKEALNKLFDALRAAVKFIIEQAKKAAVWIIEQARKAIVGFIRAFGKALEAAADVFLAAFPKARERFKAHVRSAVATAEEAVNRAADALKEGVCALLDALGAALDFILSVYQRVYNAILDALEFIVIGLIEIMEKIAHLVEAGQQMPDHFPDQMVEELTGMDLSAPLPFERTQPPTSETQLKVAQESGTLSSADRPVLTRPSLAESEITVDTVGSFTPEPELLAQASLEDGDEVIFGENPSPSRSIEVLQAETVNTLASESQVSGPGTIGTKPEETIESSASAEIVEDTEARLQALMAHEPEGGCAKEKKAEPATQEGFPEHMKFGPLSKGQRARYLFSQMKKGIKQWFSCNWPWLLAALVGALLGIIVANILTGGAVMAALPIIMQLVAAIMVGVALVRVAAYCKDYLAQGWAGQIGAAAKSLARALAIGAIELVFALLFNLGAVIKAAKTVLKTGLKASAKAAARAAKASVKTTIKSARSLGSIAKQGGRAALKNGKLVMKGIKGNIGRGARSLDELAQQLWNRVRFRKFKLVRSGRWIRLFGYINPWILLANGSLEQVTFKGEGPAKLGETAWLGRRKGVVVGIKDTPEPSTFVKDLLKKAKDPDLIKENKSLYKKLTGLEFEDARKLLTTYDELGFNTTTESMRKAVQGKKYLDPIKGKEVTPKPGTVMEPDHTFPVKKMRELPGWDKLTPAQKKAIVHDEIGLDNIKPLPKAMNRSKAERLASEWTEFAGKKVSPAYRQWLEAEQNRIEREIRKQIKKYLAEGSKP